MNVGALLIALLQYGPSIIPLVAKLVADIESGRANDTVTSADIAELVRLQGQTAEDIYRRLGIALPPVATPVTEVKA